MSQAVLILRNAGMAETAVAGGPSRSSGPAHHCEETAAGSVCTMVTECAWLQRWRAANEPILNDRGDNGYPPKAL